MSESNLSRAVALKALSAEVAARVQAGEDPNAIGAELLAAGIPPEAIDHALATYTSQVPARRGRALLATALCVVMLVGLPLAGAAGGVWAALALVVASHEPEPKPNLEAAEREVRCGNFAIAKLFSDSVITLVFGTVGLLAGAGLGLALTFPVNHMLSAWAMRDSERAPLTAPAPRN
jgi:hypothetical protein